MRKRFLISSILMIIVSAVVVPTALAAGEAKNELPFTRQVTAVPNDTSDVVSRYLARQGAISYMQGEAKNELPFTQQVSVVPNDTSDVVSRYLARRQVAETQAEPKNELPFTRRVGESAAGSSSHSGLDWTLVAIGIAAAAVAITAGVGLRRRRILQHKVPQTA